MDEVTDPVAVKEENASDYENNGEEEFTNKITLKEEPLSEGDKQETFCDRIQVKEENEDGEDQVMEMASVIMTECDDQKFENEGGYIEEDLPRPRARQKPGPKSRKRKQSESYETDRNKLEDSPVVEKRRSSRRTATISRPSTRPIPQTYRDTEVSEPDNLLYCDECAAGYDGDCPQHGPLIIVEDNEVPVDISDQSRASRTAPSQLRIADSKIPGAGCGVRAIETIRPRTRFGPYEGIIIPIVECTSYSWLIRKDGEPDHCLDGTELGLSNWMRFVNCSRNESERNLVAFQYQGKLYYRSICKIEPGEELLVWCGKEYGRQLGIHHDFSDVPTKNTKGSAPRDEALGGLFPLERSNLTHGERRELRSSKIRERYFENESLPSRVRTGRPEHEQPTEWSFPSPRFIEPTVTIHEQTTDAADADQQKHDKLAVDSLPKHSNSPRFACSICEKVFSNEESLGNHLQTHSEENVFVCVECQAQFPDGKLLIAHLNTHDEEDPFLCGWCGKRFPDERTLGAHLQIHDSKRPLKMNKQTAIEKPYECNECKQRFSEKSSLKIHQRIHTGEKPFQCELCNQRFSQKGNLKSHQRIHTGEKPFECDLCKARFSNSHNLKNHLRVHTGEKPFECNECKKKFLQKADLNRHRRIHTGEKPFECQLCKQRFSHSSSLKKHQRTHTGEKPFECEQCKQRFSHSHNLKNHLRVHTGEKPFECNECKQRFSEKNSLKIHQRIHTGEKPYECELCKQRFSQKANLKSHLRTHTGEKPFECEHCDQKFSNTHTLKNHQRVHTGEPLFECDECSRKFFWKISLDKHKRTHSAVNFMETHFLLDLRK